VTTAASEAYHILHVAYSFLPIAAGLDKFVHFLVNWDVYLSPVVSSLLGISGHSLMLTVGVVEVLAGLLCAIAPRVGSLVVCLWFCAIVVNLLTIPAYFDVALRDVGLALGAFALNRLSPD
jgi:hypothetical protein